MKYGQIDFAETSNEYKEFVDKFKPKKTTDDCYTPDTIFEAIVSWCVKEYGIARDSIVRPFYPGGDYEREDYPDGCVVLDNPPFSIITPIVRFYEEHGVRYFLFAPHLTNFAIPASCHIISGAQITYENGAVVSTSFVSNLDEYLIRSVPDLRDIIKEQDEANRKQTTKDLPKYAFPDEVLTSARCGYFATHHTELKIKASDAFFIRKLESMGEKGIFGGGYLLSNKATAERAAAERAAAELAAAHKWELSERERQIVNTLGKGEPT